MKLERFHELIGDWHRFIYEINPVSGLEALAYIFLGILPDRNPSLPALTPSFIAAAISFLSTHSFTNCQSTLDWTVRWFDQQDSLTMLLPSGLEPPGCSRVNKAVLSLPSPRFSQHGLVWQFLIIDNVLLLHGD